MIYILTGVAKAGKSFVSKQLIKSHHLQLIQTDHIMMMLHKGEKVPKIDIHASDATVSLFLEPYVKGLIETLIDQKGDFLIEGVHFLPSFVKQLLTLYHGQIRVLYLLYEHANPTDKAMELINHVDHMDNPWFSDLNQEDLVSLCSYLISESKRLGDELRKLNIPYLEIYDIKKQMPDVIKHLLND